MKLRLLCGYLAVLLLPLCASAQFTPVSNVTFAGSVTPGFTTVEKPGAIRYNPGTDEIEFFLSSVWRAPGGGSGFPLTNHADFAGFNATNVGTVFASNIIASGVISPGYAGNFVSSPLGSIRWDSTNGTLEFKNYAGWQYMGIGFPLRMVADFRTNAAINVEYINFAGSTGRMAFGSSGSYTGLLFAGRPVGAGQGSGFPLTSSVSAAGFDVTNGGVFSASSGVFEVLGTSPLPYAALVYTPSGYTHEYTPRGVTNRNDLLFSYGTTNLGVLYPGQILQDNIGSGNAYILRQPIYPTNLIPYTTNDFPWPESPTLGTAYWQLLVSKGNTGGQGIPGSHGGDGIGNMRFGPWDIYKGYDYNTNSLWVVSYGGRWYELLQSTTGAIPGMATSVWAISVDRGLSGTVIGTNSILRGAWDLSTMDYAQYDQVTYNGNLYWKNTNALGFGLATAPSTYGVTGIGTNNLYWDVLVQRGERGVQGADGNEVNSYSYFYYYTNVVQTNIIVTTTSGVTRVAAFGVTNDQSTAIYLLTGTNSSHTVDVDRASFITLQTNAAGTANAASRMVPVYVSGSYTAFPGAFILADTSADDVRIWLPQSSGSTGEVVAVKKRGLGNAAYVVAQAGDAVSGTNEVGIVRMNNVIEVVSDGSTNWWLR